MLDEATLLWLFNNGAKFSKNCDKLMLEAKGFHVVWRENGTMQEQTRLAILTLDAKIKIFFLSEEQMCEVVYDRQAFDRQAFDEFKPSINWVI